MTEVTEPVEAFEVNADDGFEAVEYPVAGVTIGGRRYEATCPKDMYWAELSLAGDDAARALARQLAFLDAALGPYGAADVNRRLRDNTDDAVSLAVLVRAFWGLADYWKPMVEKEFEALGLQLTGMGNREGRRKRAATAAKAPRASVPARKKTAAKR